MVFDKNAENILDKEEEKKLWGNRRHENLVFYENAVNITNREAEKMVKKQEAWKCGFWEECWEYHGQRRTNGEVLRDLRVLQDNSSKHMEKTN